MPNTFAPNTFAPSTFTPKTVLDVRVRAGALAFAMLLSGALACSARDLNALLSKDANGTVFSREGVDERISGASQMQPRIDAWYEGSVIALEKGKLRIFGHRLPYATLYARMMKDVDARTQGLSNRALEHRVLAIQDEWQHRPLAKSELEAPDQNLELEFALPHDRQIALLDDGGSVQARVSGPLHLPANAVVYGAPVIAKGGDEPAGDNYLHQAIDAGEIAAGGNDSDTEGLHVGDKIRVGCDSTETPPLAYVTFLTAKPTSVVSFE